jgi:hypothetical protein
MNIENVALEKTIEYGYPPHKSAVFVDGAKFGAEWMEANQQGEIEKIDADRNKGWKWSERLAFLLDEEKGKVKKLEEQLKANQWIPVTERLPTKDGGVPWTSQYPVSDGIKWGYAVYDYSIEEWSVSFTVTHWMDFRPSNLPGKATDNAKEG